MAMRDVVLIMVFVFTFGLVFAIINFVGNTMHDELVSVPEIAADTDAVEVFDSVEVVSNRLDYFGFMIFIGLTLSLIITAWIVRGHTVFMFIWIIIMIIIGILSAVLANVWSAIGDNASMAAAIANMPIMNNIILNLPIYMTVVGFVGMIIMFSKPQE